MAKSSKKLPITFWHRNSRNQCRNTLNVAKNQLIWVMATTSIGKCDFCKIDTGSNYAEYEKRAFSGQERAAHKMTWMIYSKILHHASLNIHVLQIVHRSQYSQDPQQHVPVQMLNVKW